MKVIDFYDISFDLVGEKTIKFRVNKYKIDSEDHDIEDDKIFNGFVFLKFKDPIDVRKYQVYNIDNIYYDNDNKALYIDSDCYRLIDYDMMNEIVDAIGGDFDICLANILNHFIDWFVCNLGAL